MPTLKLDGDAAGAVKATADVAKGADKIADAYKKAAKEAKALEDAAKRMIRENETPQERYNRKLSELLNLLHKGKIGTQDYERQLARLRNEMGGVANQSNRFGNFLMQWAGPAVLFSGAIAGLQKFRQELQATIDKARDQSGGMATLAQLAVVTRNPQKTFNSLANEALGAIEAGAVPGNDLNAAGNLIAALKGASLNKRDRSYLVGLQGKQVVANVDQLAPSIAALQASFPELTAKDIVGKGLATAQVGSSRIDQLIKEVGVAAPGAKQLGWSPDFVLAAGSVLDRSMASASEGATRLEAFQRQFEKFGLQKHKNLAGKGPLEVLDAISAATNGGQDRKGMESYLGNRAEAIQGVRLLIQNRAQLESLMQQSASSGGLADQFAGLPGGVPFLANAEAGRRTSGQLSTSTLGMINSTALVQAVQEAKIAANRRAGGSEIDNFFAGMAGNLAPILPEAMLTSELRQAQRDGVGDETLQRQIRDHLRSIDTKINRPQPTGRAE